MYENRILFRVAKTFYGVYNDMLGNSKNAGTRFWNPYETNRLQAWN